MKKNTLDAMLSKLYSKAKVVGGKIIDTGEKVIDTGERHLLELILSGALLVTPAYAANQVCCKTPDNSQSSNAITTIYMPGEAYSSLGNTTPLNPGELLMYKMVPWGGSANCDPNCRNLHMEKLDSSNPDAINFWYETLECPSAFVDVYEMSPELDPSTMCSSPEDTSYQMNSTLENTLPTYSLDSTIDTYNFGEMPKKQKQDKEIKLTKPEF